MPNRLVSNGVACSGPTSQRPANAEQGHLYYDTTLGNTFVQNDGDGTGSPTPGYHAANGVCAEQVTYTETAAGTYTGSVTLPAGATLLDIIVDGVALWAAASSATMTVGDAGNASGFYTAVNLKATDLLAGESLSFAQSGGKAGAYNAGTNTHWTNRFSATERVISGVITSVGAGTTGRTRMTVVYCLPRVKAATRA